MSELKSVIFAFTLIAATITGQAAGSTAPPPGQLQASVAQQVAPPSGAAISQTGLLPVFAVDIEFDHSWVDAADVPSKSPQYGHSGVNDTFQQAWDALKVGGFNMIRFPLEVGDPQAAARLANLCIWAKANNVSLIPILKLAEDSQKVKSLAAAASAFEAAVVLRLRTAQQLTAYTQISYYQIEDTMNHAGLHPKVTTEGAAETLLSVAEALRKSESQALEGSGVQATPIMVSASFDYELIRQGAIAGVPLDASMEQKAQTTLKQFLAPFAKAVSIDALNVEWFPSSISSGDVGHFASLLRELKSSLPDKQLTLTTGFSSAFHTADQQAQFLTLAVTNLADFRTSDGVNSHFLGSIFRQAFSGPAADNKAPEGTVDPTQWNWSEKGQQLSGMWSQGTKSRELTWWLGKVQDSMGLLALEPNGSGGMNVFPLPGEQIFQQISTTVAQVSQSVATSASPSAVQSFVSPTTTPGVSQSATSVGQVGAQSFVPPGQTLPVPDATGAAYSSYPSNPNTTNYSAGAPAAAQKATSPYQQLLFTLIQQVTTQLTTSLVSRLTNSMAPQMQSQYPGYPAFSPGQNMPGGAPSQNPYGTPNYTAPNYPISPPASQPAYPPVGNPGQIANAPQMYPPQPGMPTPGVATSAVWLSPQDVTVDSSSIAIGQQVHVTAQIHNGSADQDVFALTVQLIDPANPASSSQASQSGISVPRSSTAAVQLTWTASPSSAGQHLMSLQVLDGNGTQVATVAVPMIMVTSGSGLDTNLSGPPSLPPSNSFTATPSAPLPANAQSGLASVSPAAAGSAVSTPQQTVAVPPQIAFFGPTDANSAAAGGLIPTLSLQVVNPSDAPMLPVQAQLFVDGTPAQVQDVGPLLPKQTRSTAFTGVSAIAGNHSVKVVVTTADGATASSTSTFNVASTNAGPSATNSQPTNVQATNSIASAPAMVPPRGQVGVRSGAPTVYTIGAAPLPTAASGGSQEVRQQTSPPPNTAVATKVDSTRTSPTKVPLLGDVQVAGASAPARSANPSQGAGVTAGPGPATTKVSAVPPTPTSSSTAPPSTQVPTRTVTNAPPAAASAGTIPPPPVGAPVRTITPGAATGATPPANTNVPSRPGPTGSASAANTTGTTPPPPVGAPVRTITPVAATSPTPPPSTPRKDAISPAGAQAYVDLSVSVADIRVSPTPPRSGQPVSAVVTVRNLGTLDAHGATVVFKLVADGQQVAISQLTRFDIVAHGTYQATWSAPIPLKQGTQPQAVQLAIVVAVAGDVNPANNQATLSLTLQPENQLRH
ncbi:MAG TPA: hypothetical protein VNB49_17565 [Candidatus Dormibacteraeota bacterium]|nr:hypothetical protein [Candidatus Dormibacteraeota bacterium]